VHFPKAVILHAVFFHVRYAVSYHDLEEIMAERGASVDHATLDRPVVKLSPLIAANAQARKHPTAVSWRMDDPYIKVEGKWTSLCRAADHEGETPDFMLSYQRPYELTVSARSRIAMEVIRVGWAMRAFQASQQASTIAS